jgi:hypothetical protein
VKFETASEKSLRARLADKTEGRIAGVVMVNPFEAGGVKIALVNRICRASSANRGANSRQVNQRNHEP